MQKPSDPEDYELRDEYDLSSMTVVPKGRFAPERRQGKNLAVLAPDVAEAFPSDEAVNEALRLVIQMARIPKVTPLKKGLFRVTHVVEVGRGIRKCSIIASEWGHHPV
jgi:hypothetical protein